MIINGQTPDVINYRIFDCAGNLIPLVQAFDTETREVTILIQGVNLNAPEGQQMGVVVVPVEPEKDENGNIITYKFAPVTLTFIMAGAYATFNGEVVAPGEGTHPAFLAPVPQAATVEAESTGEVSIETQVPAKKKRGRKAKAE